eukprot:jgi/Picsp_1/2334/NSC_05797-R1_importin alpha isoform 9
MRSKKGNIKQDKSNDASCCADEEPPCKAAVEAGAIPVLVEALQPPQMDSTALETTFQAAWALTNLAVGEADVVRAILPVAPILIAHVSGDNGLAMAEQCAWAVGNIAEEDVEYRGILISNGAVMPLTKLLLKACSVFRAKDAGNTVLDSESLSAGETAAWALSILFIGEGDEVKPFLQAEHAMETLISVLSSAAAPISLVKEVAWLLARITSACPGEIKVETHEAILKNSVRWIELVLDPDQEFDEERDGSALKIPCLRVMGNVASAHPTVASEFFCDAQEGVKRIQMITLCAESRQYGVQREALWILSCIAGLPDSGTYQIFRQAHTIPVLMKCLKEEPYHIKKEAAFALANICLGKNKKGDPEVLNHLFGGDSTAVRAMLSLMHSADLDAIELSLDFASMMLHRLPEGKEIIQQAEGIKLLEEVQFNADISSNTLKKRAKHLVNHYWGIDDDRMKHHDD